MKKQKYTIDEAIERLEKFCADQERSHHQIEKKLYQYGMPRNCHDEILLSLIQDNFVNEERFAEAYCRGKTRINQWGRMKVRQGLQQHRVSEYNIEKALDQIDSESYEENMRDLIDRKYRYWPASLSADEKKQKTVRYLLQRGYIYDELRPVLEGYIRESS